MRITARAMGLALTAAVSLSSFAAEEDTPSLFWRGIEQLNQLMISISSLGEGGTEQGAIWQVDLQTGARRPLTRGGGFAWPVFGGDDATVYALHGRQLLRLRADRADPIRLQPAGALRKLVGVAPDGTLLAILDEGRLGRPALITPEGDLTALPQPETRDEKRHLAILLGESRAYTGDRQLVVDRATVAALHRPKGFDVYLVTPDGRRNLSECGSDPCGQPSMSLAGDRVLYIRGSGP